MIAVSDTSPTCYLILIGEIEVLPKVYSQVLLPEVVITELVAGRRENRMRDTRMRKS